MWSFLGYELKREEVNALCERTIQFLFSLAKGMTDVCLVIPIFTITEKSPHPGWGKGVTVAEM